MTFAEKLDYSEEKVTHSTSLPLPELTVPRGKTQVKTSGVRSGCGDDHNFFCALLCSHVPQHVAVPLSGPLNQNMISSAPSAEKSLHMKKEN